MLTNTETNSTPNGLASVESLGGIADLFVAEDKALAEAEAGVKSEPAPKKKKPVQEETNESEEQEEGEGEEGASQDDNEEQQETEESSESDEPVTWASALGVDDKNVVLDEEGNFSGVKVKIDGAESVVKLPDLIAGYQTNKYNTQKSQALAEDQKTFESGKNSIIELYTEKLGGIEKMTNFLEQKMLGEYQAIDWNRLRVENPAEYAASIQDFQIRQQEIQGIYQVIANEREQEQGKLKESNQKTLQEFTQQQIAKVYENNPTWKDPAVRTKALTEMEKFVGEAYGFTPQEFASVQDARLIELVKDAMKLKQGIVEGKKKLDKPLPKFQNTTGKRVRQQTKLDILTKKAKESTGMNRRTAQVDAMAELLLTSR